MGDVTGGHHFNKRGKGFISYTQKKAFDMDSAGSLLRGESKENNLRNKSQTIKPETDHMKVQSGLISNEIDLARNTQDHERDTRGVAEIVPNKPGIYQPSPADLRKSNIRMKGVGIRAR